MLEQLEPATTPAPPMDPARVADLRRQVTNLATVIIDRALLDSAGQDGSTDSPSSGVLDRAAARAFRTFLPKLRSTLLAKLNEVDPVALERLMGATATAIDSVLYYAPGEALPRWHFDWQPDGRLTLAPDEPEPSSDASREISVTALVTDA